MNRKKILIAVSCLAILVIALFVFVANLGAYRDLPEIMQKKVLRVTMYSAPGATTNEDSIAVARYELIKQFADSLKLELIVLEEEDLDESLKGLLRGKSDIIVHPVEITKSLHKRVSFTTPITANERLLLVQRADADTLLIRNQFDLAGKTIHLPKKSPYALWINNLANEIGDTIYVEQHDEANTDTLSRWVSEGKIDFTVCDDTYAKNHLLAGLDAKTPVGLVILKAWVLRKDSPKLLEEINKFLSSLQ